MHRAIGRRAHDERVWTLARARTPLTKSAGGGAAVQARRLRQPQSLTHHSPPVTVPATCVSGCMSDGAGWPRADHAPAVLTSWSSIPPHFRGVGPFARSRGVGERGGLEPCSVGRVDPVWTHARRFELNSCQIYSDPETLYRGACRASQCGTLDEREGEGAPP
jgi:hypothetical protein